jgi:prolyl-tRNA editing enzyme YbaK/EbsC (Cys-tRNA(Pro) deacylase)
MRPATSASALRVQAVLGTDFAVLEFDTSTRTAADAAAAIGCTVGQIAKSLIFRALDSGRPVLAIASGSVRVDEARLSELLGEGIGRADAAFVREHTGYAIGGVPPVGHSGEPVIFIDQTLLTFETIWAAGGTPNAVFRLTPDDLVRLTGGTVAAIAAGDRVPG